MRRLRTERQENLKARLERIDNVHTEVTRVAADGDGFRVFAEAQPHGETLAVTGEHILLAAGRRSNADLLQVGRTGIRTDSRGYFTVNDHLEASVSRIWALGDVIGRRMFKHVANRESRFAWYHSRSDQKAAVDCRMTPHAVFSHPQIASVGLTEAQEREDHRVVVGRADNTDVAKGTALRADKGLAKAVVAAEPRNILGFHIIGSYAPILIQDMVDVMATDGRASALSFGIHIHPALPELVERAMEALRPAEEWARVRSRSP
jgi:dihydrolipoamide dehydrogenase